MACDETWEAQEGQEGACQVTIFPSISMTISVRRIGVYSDPTFSRYDLREGVFVTQITKQRAIWSDGEDSCLACTTPAAGSVEGGTLVTWVRRNTVVPTAQGNGFRQNDHRSAAWLLRAA